VSTASDRAAAFLDDIEGEPAILARLLDAYATPDGPLAALPVVLARRRLVLTGLGSSRFAALTAASFLAGRGVVAVVEHASATAALPPSEDLAVVGISASGRTPEAVAALERHRGIGLTVAVTAHPERGLGAAADVTLPLLTPDERSGVACATYLATVAALLLLAGRLAGGYPEPRDLRPAVLSLEALLAERDGWLPAAADLLEHAETLHVVAGAGRLGSAEQAALMLREAPRLPAVAWEAGDWGHVAVYTALPRSRMVLFGGTPYDSELVRTMAERGGAVLAIGPAAAGAAVQVPLEGADDPLVRALVEVCAIELVAAELWRRARAWSA
jgi:fructoselysine-6-P-deglycase FrlB-like protein